MLVSCALLFINLLNMGSLIKIKNGPALPGDCLEKCLGEQIVLLELFHCFQAENLQLSSILMGIQLWFFSNGDLSFYFSK